MEGVLKVVMVGEEGLVRLNQARRGAAPATPGLPGNAVKPTSAAGKSESLEVRGHRPRSRRVED